MEPDTPRGRDGLGLDDATATRIAELAEARMMWATVAVSPREVRETLGIQAARIGSGIALAMAHDPTGGYWNKAIAHGLTGPVDDALIAELVGFYEGAGAPAAAIQIPPALLPEDWDDIAGRYGLKAGTRLHKMLRHRSAPTAGETELDVRGVDTHHSEAWARVLIEGFGMPTEPALVEMISSTIGRDFFAFGAWDGDRLVASGGVHLGGDVAALSGAATLPDARGRGAQTGLLTARIRAAVDAGCTWISAETGSERGVDRSMSFRNLRRAGFVELYERPNWVWRPAA